MASTSLESATSVRLFNPATANHNIRLNGVACRRIRVASAGNLSLILLNDTSPVTLTGLVVGEVLDVQAVATRAVGSTVSAIEVFY